MIRVWTPSRLHFGLLSLPTEEEAGTGRCFGGVGLMVQGPGVQVSATPAAAWSAEGPLAARALALAQRLAASVQAEQPGKELTPQRLIVENTAPEHVGLGTGTQLGLAVGRAVALAWGLPLEAHELARRLGRGLRSALGVHGFAHGGLLVEAGKRQTEEIAPLVARLPFPSAWRIVLAWPGAAVGLHGQGEQDAFSQLLWQTWTTSQTDALCRLVLLGLLPAVVEQDLQAFGEALFDFNARAGEVFSAVQGGTYAGAAAAELVAFVRGLGVRGVGQSSWGPTVFAVTGDAEQASDLGQRIQSRFGLSQMEVHVTQACNHGATVSMS